MTSLSVLAKMFGLVQTSLLAFYFGASGFMDSYYIALSISNLCSTAGQTAIEASLLPEIHQIYDLEDGNAAKGLISVAFWFLSLTSMVLITILGIHRKEIISVFANGFDETRSVFASKLLLLFLPLIFLRLMKSVYDTWVLFRQKYILPSVLENITKILPIPFLVLLIPYGGINVVPLVLGGTYGIVLCYGYYVEKNEFPFFLQYRSLTRLLKIFQNVLLCLLTTSANLLYVVTDKYFASFLHVGAVSEMSYATLLFQTPLIILSPVLLLFLAKISESKTPVKLLENALDVALTYMIPVSMALCCMSIKVVDLLWGYGAFNSDSVFMTGICLMIYSLSLPYAFCCNAYVRYGQSIGNLRQITIISYIGGFVNIILDIFLGEIWGLPGIAFATSSVILITFFIYSVVFLKGFSSCNYLLKKQVKNLLLGLIWFCGINLLSKKLWFMEGSITHIIVVIIICIFHFVIAERLHILDNIPEKWMPSDFWALAKIKFSIFVKRS